MAKIYNFQEIKQAREREDHLDPSDLDGFIAGLREMKDERPHTFNRFTTKEQAA